MVALVNSCLAGGESVNIDDQRKSKRVLQAKAVLDQALARAPSREKSLVYYRGVLQFYLHQFFEAMEDFDSLIGDEEEANAKFFLARGRAYACLSMFPEAIKDLTAAIAMDEDLLDAYLNRGKCAYLLGDTALAFLDFQKLILIEPKNPMVHVYAGNLLMTTGSYDDAAKAFSNADSVRKCPLAIYQRARCNVALA